MIHIVPVASPLHPRQLMNDMLEDFQTSGVLGDRRRYRISSREEALDNESMAILVMTGGTESKIQELVSQKKGPVVLLAHAFSNSFPAALEVLARLQQTSGKGKILWLDQTPESKQNVAATYDILECHQALKKSRIGVIGTPSDWLIASMPDYDRVHDLWKPELVDIPMDELISTIQSSTEKEYGRYRPTSQSCNTKIVEPSPSDIEMACKVCDGIANIVTRYKLQAYTIRCFDLVRRLKTTGCLALSCSLDQGIIAGCEGDLPSTLTMLWMNLLARQIPFMANPQAIYPLENSVDMAHCTIALNWAKEFTLRSHFESSLGVAIQADIEPSPITIARIGGNDLQGLFVSEGKIIHSDYVPLRCRTQMRVELEEDVRYFIRHPLGNHHVLIRGRFARCLKEYHELYIA